MPTLNQVFDTSFVEVCSKTNFPANKKFIRSFDNIWTEN